MNEALCMLAGYVVGYALGGCGMVLFIRWYERRERPASRAKILGRDDDH